MKWIFVDEDNVFSRWRGGLRFKNFDEYFFRLTDGVWREAGREKITQAPTAAGKRKPTSQRGPAPYFSGYVQYIFPLDYNVSVILSFNFHACVFPQTRTINCAMKKIRIGWKLSTSQIWRQTSSWNWSVHLIRIHTACSSYPTFLTSPTEVQTGWGQTQFRNHLHLNLIHIGPIY